MDEQTLLSTPEPREVKQLNIKTLTPFFHYWFNTTCNGAVTVYFYYAKLYTVALTIMYLPDHFTLVNSHRLNIFTLLFNSIHSPKFSLFHTFNTGPYRIFFKAMTNFTPTFLNTIFQRQNQIILKKIFFSFSQNNYLFKSFKLLPFLSQIPVQRAHRRTNFKQQRPALQKASMSFPFFHKVFELTSWSTTRLNVCNRFQIEKKLTSNQPITTRVKNVQKLNVRTRRLSLMLQQSIPSLFYSIVPSTLQVRSNFTLALDKSKRLNLLASPLTWMNSVDLRLKTKTTTFQMLELFASAQAYASRKYRHNIFIKKYLPLRVRQQHAPTNFNVQKWFEHTTHHKAHSQRVQLNTYPVKSKLKAYQRSSKTPYFYVPTELYSFNSYSNPYLPKLEYFTKTHQHNPVVNLHLQSRFVKYTLKIASIKTRNNLQVESPFQTNSFKIGFTFPSFLNISNLVSDLAESASLSTIVSSHINYSSFVTTLTTKRFLTLLTQQRKLLTLCVDSFTPSKTILQRTLTKYSHRFTDVTGPTFTSPNRLVHVRFKPGYSRQWRDFRRDFREFFFLKKRYQYRLTRYLTHATIAQRKCRLLPHILFLDKVLVYAKLVVDRSAARSYISTGLTFLNGSQVANSDAQVLPNDFIQLTIFLKYYMVHKFQQNQIFQQRRVLGRLLWQRGKNWTKSNCNFPNWAKKLDATFLDVPLALEVDYFSSSCYVLDFTNVDSSNRDTYPNVLPLYNWKYIV